jgi:hypothetical protein
MSKKRAKTKDNLDKKPEKQTVTETRKLSVEGTIKKAIEISKSIDTDASFDIYNDGVVISNCIGRLRGFIPFDNSASLPLEIVKALDSASIDMSSVRCCFEPTPRHMNKSVAVTTWRKTDDCDLLLNDEFAGVPCDMGDVKAFCYDKSRMEIIGATSFDVLCKAFNVDVQE